MSNIIAPPVGQQHLVQLLREAELAKMVWQNEHRERIKEIGSGMRKARKAAGVSLRELARRMGCSAPYLSDMEIGNREYSSRWMFLALKKMAPPGMNHWCPGESKSGEWSCRSEEVPSKCHYCGEPNQALLNAASSQSAAGEVNNTNNAAPPIG